MKLQKLLPLFSLTLVIVLLAGYAHTSAAVQSAATPTSRPPTATPTPIPPSATPTATPDLIADFVTYRNEAGTLSFQHPPGWLVLEEGLTIAAISDETLVEPFLRNSDYSQPVGFVIGVVGPTDDLDSDDPVTFFEEWQAQLEYSDRRPVPAGELITSENGPIRRASRAFTENRDGNELHFTVVSIVNGGLAGVFFGGRTGSAPEEQGALATAILDTIELEFLDTESTAAPLKPTAVPLPTRTEAPAGPSIPSLLTPDQISEIRFKTPEEAILHYFEGVAQADAAKIFQACAIDEMSEKFRFDLYTERFGMYMPVMSLSPTDYPFYVEINKIQRSAQILNRVKIFAFSLLSDEAVGGGIPIIIDPEEDGERIGNFVQDVDPTRLAQLKVEKIGLPDETRMNSDQYLESAAKLARAFGADESTERVALFSFAQNYYYLGFTLLRYGETWKIGDQFSPLAKTDTLGSPNVTTVAEFEDMIAGSK